MDPFVADGHEAAAGVAVAVKTAPVPMLVTAVPVQPLASVNVILCAPFDTPVKMPVVLVAAPSNMYVTGKVPLEVMVILPLFIPGQEVAIGVAFPANAGPAITVAVVVPPQPLEAAKLILCKPAATLVKIPVVFVVTPSKIKVIGATPLDVAVIVPSAELLQEVAVGVADPFIEVPAVTVVEVVPEQLLLSVKEILCKPAETLVKIPVVLVVTPSKTKVIGAAPVEITVMLPLLIPGQAAAVAVAVPVMPVPAPTVLVIEPVQPFTSVNVTVCDPLANPGKIPVVFVVDPSKI